LHFASTFGFKSLDFKILIMNSYSIQSSSILPDHEIDDILFGIPDESDDDLDLGDLDELVYDFNE